VVVQSYIAYKWGRRRKIIAPHHFTHIAHLFQLSATIFSDGGHLTPPTVVSSYDCGLSPASDGQRPSRMDVIIIPLKAFFSSPTIRIVLMDMAHGHYPATIHPSGSPLPCTKLRYRKVYVNHWDATSVY
jgi:hypothetical protein